MLRLTLAIGLSVFVAALLLPAVYAKDKDDDSCLQEIEKLREEITLVNLINGLNLTDQQLKDLIALGKEIQARRDSAKERYQKLAEDTAAAFSDLRVNLLAKGTHIPEDVAGKAASLNDRLKELQEKQVTEFEGYASKVCAILTDAQKAVISTFKPCLLPPKSQRNPVLVGQGAEKDGAVNLLRRLRELPDKKLADKKEGFLKGQFEKAKKGGSDLTAEEKAAERDRLFKIVERVRAMSDEEFELEKSELATEFEVKDRVHELHEELGKLVADRDPERQERGMAKYFLKPQMLPILEDRLKNLESFKQEGQVDLDKTPSTERPG